MTDIFDRNFIRRIRKSRENPFSTFLENGFFIEKNFATLECVHDIFHNTAYHRIKIGIFGPIRQGRAQYYGAYSRAVWVQRVGVRCEKSVYGWFHCGPASGPDQTMWHRGQWALIYLQTCAGNCVGSGIPPSLPRPPLQGPLQAPSNIGLTNRVAG